MTQLKKPIRVRLLPDADEYLGNLDERVKRKFLSFIEKTSSGVKGKWFMPIKNFDGIWEFRYRDHQHFYRVLAFWDSSQPIETLILASHGFNKKTNKTPWQEIKNAERIKAEYFK